MKEKTIIAGIVMILMLGMVSALYSGETYSQNLSDTFDEIIVFEIVGNTSFVDYDITNMTLNIKVSEIAEEDNYNITIKGYKNEEERVVYVHSGGGGSSKTIYKNVTQYVNVPNNTIEYIDRIIEKNITTEVPLEPKDKQSPIFAWVITGAILLMIIYSVIRSLLLKKKEVKNE